MAKKRLKPFDKYDYYFRSVQDPSDTLTFVSKTYKEIKGRAPVTFGEDFCGTFNLSTFWASREGNRSVAVDLDPEPLRYGKKHNLPRLEPDEQKRVQVIQADVRSKRLPKVDVIGAFNFSYYVLKERKTMVEYLTNVRRRLGKDGVLMMDCFGGTHTIEPNEEHTNMGDFVYHWDQVSFDPISHEAMFYIHFKRKGEKKRSRVFKYDWRMWTLPELRDMLREVGFKNVIVYWEGTDAKGGGNNIFKPTKRTSNCPAWIALVVAHG